MEEKEKPQGLAADGAEVEVGVTDTDNDNTPQRPMSNDGSEPEGFVLPVVGAYDGKPVVVMPDDDDGGDAGKPAKAGAASKGKPGKGKAGAASKAGYGAPKPGDAWTINLPEYAAMAYDELLEFVTDGYIADVGKGLNGIHLRPNGVPRERDSAREILRRIRYYVNERNKFWAKEKDRWSHVKVLPDVCIERLLYTWHGIRRADMNSDGANGMRVLLYTGEGNYTTDEEEIYNVVLKYNSTYALDDFLKNLYPRMRQHAPLREITEGIDNVFLNNAVYDYATDDVIYYGDPAFDPEKYVTVHKFPIDWVDVPHGVTFTTRQGQTFTPVSFFETLFEKDDDGNDDGRAHLVLQMLCALLRPFVPWDISFLFLQPEGAGGKGTICQIAADIAGKQGYRSIPLHRMANEFTLDGIERFRLIIGNENLVNKYLDNVGVYKELVTGDALDINRKHRAFYTAVFHGMVIQCFNSMPKVADKSGSFYRRLTVVPFDKSFVDMDGDKRVKAVFWKSKEALEDLVHYLLRDLPKFYDIDVPEVCKRAKNDVMRENSSAASFLYDVFHDDGEGVHGVNDCYALDTLYHAYEGWYASQGGGLNGKLIKKNFKSELQEYLRSTPAFGWEYPRSQFEVTADMRNGTDPMLDRYIGAHAYATPAAKQRIRGIRRVKDGIVPVRNDGDDDVPGDGVGDEKGV